MLYPWWSLHNASCVCFCSYLEIPILLLCACSMLTHQVASSSTSYSVWFISTSLTLCSNSTNTHWEIWALASYHSQVGVFNILNCNGWCLGFLHHVTSPTLFIEKNLLHYCLIILPYHYIPVFFIHCKWLLRVELCRPPMWSITRITIYPILCASFWKVSVNEK